MNNNRLLYPLRQTYDQRGYYDYTIARSFPTIINDPKYSRKPNLLVAPLALEGLFVLPRKQQE